MSSEADRDAVLITGVYGSGKSSVAAEIADILEKRGDRFAYIDLDFLAWGYQGDDDAAAERRMMLKNLATVVANYLAVGVRFFILAGFVGEHSGLNNLRNELRMPLRIVRLSVPLEEIERRLAADVTAGRKDDLREAAVQLANSKGVGEEDLTVLNDRPIREVAMEVLGWLGWQ
jgi:adenylylsulfate kinase-like enzyme